MKYSVHEHRHRQIRAELLQPSFIIVTDIHVLLATFLLRFNPLDLSELLFYLFLHLPTQQ